jgi:hypothetical protein
MSEYFTASELAETLQITNQAEGLIEDLEYTTFDVLVYDGNGETIATIQCYEGQAHIIFGKVKGLDDG